MIGPPRLEDKPWGEEEQLKNSLNFGHLIAEILSEVEIC